MLGSDVLNVFELAGIEPAGVRIHTLFPQLGAYSPGLLQLVQVSPAGEAVPGGQ